MRLRVGPTDAPVLIVAPALFEEANRTRAFTLAVMRAMADQGIATMLPDLPGTGESLVATEDARLTDWRTAFAAARPANGRHVLAIRGGALVGEAAEAAHRYHLSPVTGAAFVRDLLRTRLASGGPLPDRSADGPPIELAGNRIARAMLADLEAASPGPADRTARLASDPAAADIHFPGRPLWRASEPDVDPALAHTLAADVAAWMRSCGG